MSTWVGGLPPQPKSNDDAKKAKKGGKPGSPPDHGGHQKTFFGGAIPPIPPKLPECNPEDLKPPKVTFVGGPPAVKSSTPAAPPPSPKAPPPTPPATPSTPSPPPPPTPPATHSTPSPPPPPPPCPVSEPTPPSYSPPPLPKCLPSVFDSKPKKKKRPPPPPVRAPVECGECEEHSEGDGNVGKLPSFFAICHIPATRQGLEQDDGVCEKEDRSGHASPRPRDEDEGPDIPPEVPRYIRGNAFAGIFGKKIDARNLAEVGPHGWHPSANAPYDITDTRDTVTVGPSGRHEPRNE